MVVFAQGAGKKPAVLINNLSLDGGQVILQSHELEDVVEILKKIKTQFMLRANGAENNLLEG